MCGCWGVVQWFILHPLTTMLDEECCWNTILRPLTHKKCQSKKSSTFITVKNRLTFFDTRHILNPNPDLNLTLPKIHCPQGRGHLPLNIMLSLIWFDFNLYYRLPHNAQHNNARPSSLTASHSCRGDCRLAWPHLDRTKKRMDLFLKDLELMRMDSLANRAGHPNCWE